MRDYFCYCRVLAALGYSDVAICHSIRQKTRQSATLLLLYSGVLLLLVLLTRSIPVLQWVPALFAPLGHEAVIQYGRQQETQGTPRFTAPEQGVLVLDVQQGSPAARAGLHSEDWIIQLDGQAVRNRPGFFAAAIFIIRSGEGGLYAQGQNETVPPAYEAVEPAGHHYGS